MPVEGKKELVDKDHPDISISKQAQLLGISRSTIYYQPLVNLEQLELMKEIDKIYMEWPSYGSRRIAKELTLRLERKINRKPVQRLMRLMGLEAIYPKPNLSRAGKGHKIYPYLLRNVAIERIDQVWSTDITYIPIKNGWAYLVAIIDWKSRYVLSWELSTTMDSDFCLRSLDKAFAYGKPEIFNTDQGSQFTTEAFTGKLKERDINISMDGRGRALDNIFVERLWRSLKYEEVYLRDYQTIQEARQAIALYFQKYNYQRLHQSLDYRTPAEAYFNANQRLPIPLTKAA